MKEETLKFVYQAKTVVVFDASGVIIAMGTPKGVADALKQRMQQGGPTSVAPDPGKSGGGL